MSNLVLFNKVPEQQQNDRMELFMLIQAEAKMPVAVVSDDPEYWAERLNESSKSRVKFVLSDSALQRLSLFNSGTQILVDPRLRSQTKAALATVALRVRVPITYAS